MSIQSKSTVYKKHSPLAIRSAIRSLLKADRDQVQSLITHLTLREKLLVAEYFNRQARRV